MGDSGLDFQPLKRISVGGSWDGELTLTDKLLQPISTTKLVQVVNPVRIKAKTSFPGRNSLCTLLFLFNESISALTLFTLIMLMLASVALEAAISV